MTPPRALAAPAVSTEIIARYRPGAAWAMARGAAAGALAMACVGGSVAVTGTLARAPVYTAEAVRYAAACLALLAFARARGRAVPMPRAAEWLWLSGIAVTGLVVFNVALADGARDAEPAPGSRR